MSINIYIKTYKYCNFYFRLERWKLDHLDRRLDHPLDVQNSDALHDAELISDENNNNVIVIPNNLADLCNIQTRDLSFFNIGVITDYFISNNKKNPLINGRKMALKKYTNYLKMAIQNCNWYIKSECFSSHTRSKVYEQHIIINEADNSIIHTNCSCVVGKGSIALCKHISCILFVVENYALTGKQLNIC